MNDPQADAVEPIRVFCNHRHVDRDVVREFAEHLRIDNIDAWLDAWEITTSTSTPDMRADSSNPDAQKALSIGPFPARTVAVNRSRPLATPMAARCSMSSVPIPQPCRASVTTNATSASVVEPSRS